MIQQRKIAVVGLGYVGLTIATAFGQIGKVIGFDKSPERIKELTKGFDRNNEISSQQLKKSEITYTTHPQDLHEADFYIIAVPTPLDKTKHPDLSMIVAASHLVGQYLKKGDIVVYESSVYPGATEEECIPVLERVSNLRCGRDFGVGFSPERINPADKEHTFENIKKIVSGINTQTLDTIAAVYGTVVKAGVHRVSSIKVAEATKIVENTQRDVNIALVNEIALLLQHVGINIAEVLEAAQTKWNFLPFKPGLVGGHCIGINSYYLAHKAQQVGYYPEIILAAQRVNDSLIKYIADETIKKLIPLKKPLNETRIGILGVTYKENYADYHDSKVLDLIKELKSYDAQIVVHDPLADYERAKKEYNLPLESWDELNNLDAIIVTLAHEQYTHLGKAELKNKMNHPGVIMDVKGILNPTDFAGTDITLWKL